MEMLMDTRKQFEAWRSPHGLWLSRSTEPGCSDDYENTLTHVMWNAWQAAIAAEREACAALCKELADCEDNTGAYLGAARWCAERIMARANASLSGLPLGKVENGN